MCNRSDKCNFLHDDAGPDAKPEDDKDYQTYLRFKEAHDEELKGKQKSALDKNGWPTKEVHDAMKNSWQPVEEESHPWEVH